MNLLIIKYLESILTFITNSKLSKVTRKWVPHSAFLENICDFLIMYGELNPHTPVAQKVADEVVFRRFQGEGVEFLLENTILRLSSFHFQWVFISRSVLSQMV